MVTSAKKWVNNVPMSCDTYNVNCWYIENYVVLIENEFKNLVDKGIDPMEAFEKEAEARPESTRSQLYEILKNNLPEVPENVDTSYKSFSTLD